MVFDRFLQVEHIWRVIDVGHSGKVDLDEFLAAMTDWSKLENEMESNETTYNDLLEEVFQIFDEDGSGVLNVDEVAAVCAHLPFLIPGCG